MDASLLSSKGTKYHTKTYRKAYGRDLSEPNFKDHLNHGAQSDEVIWLKPYEIFKVDELPLKGVVLVESVDARKYN